MGSGIRFVYLPARLIQVRTETKWPLEYSRKNWFMGPPKLPPEIILWEEQLKQAKEEKLEAMQDDVVPPEPKFRGTSHVAVRLPKIRALQQAARLDADAASSSDEESDDEAARRREERKMDKLLSYYRGCAHHGIVPEKPMGVNITYKDYAYLFMQAGEDRDIVRGKWGHAHAVSRGYRANRYLGNCIMIMYKKCGYVEEAQKVFDDIVWKNVYTWALLMRGYAEQGEYRHAVWLFKRMLLEHVEKPNRFCFSCCLTCIGLLGDLQEGKLFHEWATEMELATDSVVGNALISMYGKCGAIQEAKETFDLMQARNEVTWNALIIAFAQNGMHKEIEWCLPSMECEGVTPDRGTWIGYLEAFPISVEKSKVRQAHKRMFDLGMDSACHVAIMKAYGRCGHVKAAVKTFEAMQWRDSVAWTALITTYAVNGYGDEAFSCYRRMQHEGDPPSSATIISLADVCHDMGDLKQARELHSVVRDARFLHSDIPVQNALLTLLGELGSLEDAKQIFESMQTRDIFSWNALMFLMLQHKAFREVVEVYRKMQLEGEEPDSVSFAGVLDACAMIKDLTLGKKVHHHAVEESRLTDDTMVRNALVNMYGKNGKLEAAKRVFKRIYTRDLASWNAIISAAPRSEEGKDFVLETVKKMDLEGVKGDNMTYLTFIKACANFGLASEGKELHSRVSNCHDFETLKPAFVEMFGICGSWAEAKSTFDTVVDKDEACWTALVGASAGSGISSTKLLQEMDLEGFKPGNRVYARLLDVCEDPTAGQRVVRSRIDEASIYSDHRLSSSLLDMYSSSGCLTQARDMFARMSSPGDVHPWNSMMAAYTRDSMGKEAFGLLQRMDMEGVKLDGTSFVILLEACEDEQQVDGIYKRFRRSNLKQSNMLVEAALINAYARCISVEECRKLFDRMKVKSELAWTEMLAAYKRTGSHEDEVRKLAAKMEQEGFHAVDGGSTGLLSRLTCSRGGEKKLTEVDVLTSMYVTISPPVVSSLDNMDSWAGVCEELTPVEDDEDQTLSISNIAMMSESGKKHSSLL